MTVVLTHDMYDAVPGLVTNIPVTASYVAGYVDSVSFTWPASAWARFPHAVHVTITTSGRLDADFADVENGDLTPQQGYSLYQAGRIKGIYCSFSAWQSVQDVFNTNHKAQPPYWIAQYPGGGRVMPILNGVVAVAHQYASTPGYDLSCITDTFLAIVGGKMTDPLQTPLARLGAKEDGTPQTGTTTLGTVVQWFDSNLSVLAGKIDAVGRQVASAQTELDNRLTAVSGALAGLAPGADAVTLAAALAGPLATDLVPLLPAQVRPADFFAALATQLAKQ